MQYKVSVIIPIYKVSRFIERCAESLMQQTLNEVEYIFVNDATPDNSMELLRGVIARHPAHAAQVKIVEHEHNKGLPAARNTGLAAATGEYIFHCDSDDYVEPEMLEHLYNAAKKKNADVVWCDWFLTFEKKERYMRQPSYDTSMDALKAMLSGGMKFNVWNKLVRRSLYVDYNILFPEGNGMGEDMTMLLLFVHANVVEYLPKAYYHYVKYNSGAFSQTYSNKHLEELKYNVKRVEQYIKRHCGDVLEQEIAFLKLEAKFPFLVIGASRELLDLWRSWFPEANTYIGKNDKISVRSRMLQKAAAKGYYWFVWLHYYLVIRFMYGIVYR